MCRQLSRRHHVFKYNSVCVDTDLTKTLYILQGLLYIMLIAVS